MATSARGDHGQVLLARAYLGIQAAAGVLWWIAVYASDDVRRATLGLWSADALLVPDLVFFAGASAVAAATGSRLAATVVSVWAGSVTVALSLHAIAEDVGGWGVVLMAVSTIGTAAATATLWRGQLPLDWFFSGPFRFQSAPDRPRRAHLMRSLAQLVVFWSFFFLAFPVALAAVERELHVGWGAIAGSRWDATAAVVLVAASALGLWSCTTMARRGEGTPLPAESARNLVVAGPYRFVRNPMALAGGLQTASVGLWLGSWTVIASAGAGAVLWNSLIRPVEEADLAARFGQPYEAYRLAVRCWIPTIGPAVSR